MARFFAQRGAIGAALVLGLAAAFAAPKAQAAQPGEAEPATVAANQNLAKTLPLDDDQDFRDAKQGFIAALPDAFVRGPNDKAAFSMKPFAFEDNAQAPATVNPSLWRQARLNAIHGLFQVTEGVYQVRGIDIANMTIVEGETGIIVIDCLLTTETAKAALQLYFSQRGEKPVKALIYSHSHIDHFGGGAGVVSQNDAAAKTIAVIAPTGFMESAVAENVLAGPAMTRRAQYMYGTNLPVGERGFVDDGLGKTLARGSASLIAPNDLIVQSVERRMIDGVELVFQLTPGTEAPSEMNIYLPKARVLDLAENVSHTMHNLYTLRGAQIRDGALWSHFIDASLALFGDQSDMLIGQHHWPIFGGERLRAYVSRQRDLYKFINDQSLRLADHGARPDEIAEQLKLPKSLSQDFGARGYYGTLKHNARAVYQKYLGCYDSNPAHLDPPPQEEQARRTVAYMGGAQAVIAKAREDFAKGDYRWVADVMNTVVFAEPKNQQARELAAAAYEQLAYQAESAPWRNEYLSAAQELRFGRLQSSELASQQALIKGVPLDLFFDMLGVRLNLDKAEGQVLRLNWTFGDLNETYVVNLSNSALTWRKTAPDPNADATLTLTRPTLDAIALKQLGVLAAVATGKLSIGGDPRKAAALFSMLDDFSGDFAIVEPKP